MGFNFILKKSGSNKAIITGNVYKDNIPTATLDFFNAQKYVIQWAAIKTALIINGVQCLLDLIDKLIFFNRQKIYKKTTAKAERNQTITSEGIAIYFPKTPEVLIKKVANNKPDKFLIWLFSIIKFSVKLLTLYLSNQS